jgi:hypothetical protein
LSNHCGIPAALALDGKVNKKNVIVSLIMVLTNALTLALFRASPSGQEMIGFVYVMIGITTLIIIWLLIFNND